VRENPDKLEKQVERIDAKVDAVKDSVAKLQVETKDGFLALVDRIAASERGIRSDLKTLLKAGISACVFFLSLFAAGYYRLDERMSAMQERMDERAFAIQESMSALQVTVGRIAQAHGIQNSPEAPAERDARA
jgi:hypothetical protein